MDYNNIYKAYQIQSAENVLDADEAYYYRKILRWYSAKFHTPLYIVETLDVGHVLTNYYEATMEAIPYDELYDIVVEDFLPEIFEQQKDSADEFAAYMGIEEAKKQANRMKLNKNTNKPAKINNKPESLMDIDKSKADNISPPDINMTFQDDEP